MNQSDPVTVDRLKRNGSLPGDSPIPEGPEETLPITSFAPPVDIYEDENTITLKLEVPRIDEKEIDVRIENKFRYVTEETRDDRVPDAVVYLWRKTSTNGTEK